jgi:long-chain acyl-CoA synthetase
MKHKPWLATYAANAIPAGIDADAYTSVAHLIDAAMLLYADKPAFHSFGQTLSYADVDRLSGAFAAWLQTALGIKPGDRIAVMLPNVMAFPIACLGIIRTGAIQVNVNPMYTPRELEHQLKDSGSETIVVFNGVTSTLAEVIGSSCINTVVTVALSDGTAGQLPSPTVDARLTGSIPFAQALQAGAGMKRTPVDIKGSDLLFLQYTGGTTGISKGAALSHRNLVANTEQFKAMMPSAVRAGQEVVVTAIPLYHIFALMVNFITYFSVGSANWLVANPRDMDGFVETLKQSKLTVFFGVNTLFGGLVLHPRIGEVDFSRLRLTGGGGAAVVGATSAKWKQITGQFIREGYGLSETGPVLSFNPASITDFTGTTGLPLSSTDIKLLDDAGVEVPIGQAGEVCAKGPQVMGGYWNQPAANAAAFTADGYFRTGDVGMFDAEGFLKIVDRKKDMILVSGFNVYPNEVEAVASSCPGVAECACIGVPDDRTGEGVKLYVVKADATDLRAEAVLAHCREGLAAYKVPKVVEFIPALPKSTVGKILRRELRQVKPPVQGVSA